MTVNGANGTSVNAGNGNAAVNGYTMIQIDPDGGWSYHAPNGDIVEVDADGSWERVGPSGNIEVKADGSWEQTGENGVVEVEANGAWKQTGGKNTIEVPSVPLKPVGATVNPVKPVQPK